MKTGTKIGLGVSILLFLCALGIVLLWKWMPLDWMVYLSFAPAILVVISILVYIVVQPVILKEGSWKLYVVNYSFLFLSILFLLVSSMLGIMNFYGIKDRQIQNDDFSFLSNGAMNNKKPCSSKDSNANQSLPNLQDQKEESSKSPVSSGIKMPHEKPKGDYFESPDSFEMEFEESEHHSRKSQENSKNE